MYKSTKIRGKKTRKSKGIGHNLHTQAELHGMLLPGSIIMLVFNIIPLFGLIIAFKNYKPSMGVMGIFTSAWNDLFNFKQVFKSSQFWSMLGNTLGINLIGQFVSIIVTILFALLLNEIKSKKFKALAQTATYMPHFLSWVVFGGLCINLMQPDGILNQILISIGIIQDPIIFLAKPSYFWGIAIITGLIKDLGWGAILYLAAIAGIDPVLYEAATIDGANRFNKMRHVTLPGILSTIMIMLIFAVAGMLNNNFTQIYVFQNVLNLPTSQVIDTYVYQIGLEQFQFGIGAAVSLMKSIFAVLLLVLANLASKKLTDSGLF